MLATFTHICIVWTLLLTQCKDMVSLLRTSIKPEAHDTCETNQDPVGIKFDMSEYPM